MAETRRTRIIKRVRLLKDLQEICEIFATPGADHANVAAEMLAVVHSIQRGLHSGEYESMAERSCCEVGCGKPAEFVVYGGSGHPEDYLETCLVHVGEMLVTPEWIESQNHTWAIHEIADVERTAEPGG